MTSTAEEIANRKELDSKFGEVLYRMESKKTKSVQTVILFYDQCVVFQKETSFLCYPVMFSQEIIPKYKFKNVAVSKGNPIKAIVIGILAFLVGIQQISENVEIGAALLVLGLIIMAIPFYCSTFDVDFEITTSKDTGIMRVFRDLFGSGLRMMTVVTDVEPDTSFMTEYVYGTLSENMHEMHLTHHLIHDDLTEIVKPQMLTDIQDGDEEAAVAVAIEAHASDMEMSCQEIKSAKFGKLVHRMESKYNGGVFYSEQTVVLFHDQLVIFQLEKKILCWPMWYVFLCVPIFCVYILCPLAGRCVSCSFTHTLTLFSHPRPLLLLLRLLQVFSMCHPQVQVQGDEHRQRR
jgi:hypothetical protein